MLKIQPQTIRNITGNFPFLGRFILPLLKKYEDYISPLGSTVIINLKGGYGKFEIRNIQEYIQKIIYFLGAYELRETRLVKKILQPGDTFIDIGANIGWFSINAAKHLGTTGKIFAFEPSSKIYDHLQANVKLNELAQSITKLEQVALSNSTSQTILSNTVGSNSGRTSIVNNISLLEAGSITEEVKTITFDDYYQQENLGKIKLVKIDVEGAELKVLQGMNSALENRVFDYILIEVCESHLKQAGSSSQELLNILKSHGYSLHVIQLFGTKLLANTDNISFANILAKKNV